MRECHAEICMQGESSIKSEAGTNGETRDEPETGTDQPYH